jgi:hypothetical protein
MNVIVKTVAVVSLSLLAAGANSFEILPSDVPTPVVAYLRGKKDEHLRISNWGCHCLYRGAAL